MKKLYLKLSNWWKAETPAIARFFQFISSVIAALPMYFATLPLEFRESIPTNYLKYIALTGGLCALILQFFKKTPPKEE